MYGEPVMLSRDRGYLIVILLAHFLLVVGYSIIAPLGETPDEVSHYEYFRFVAQERRLPQGHEVDEAIQPPLYYLLGAALTSGIDMEFPFVRSNPDFSLSNPTDPPNLFIHTALEQFPYRDSALAMHLVRLLSAVLSCITLWAVYGLGRCLFPNQPAVALGAAGFLAFIPEFLFLSGAINNDNLAATLGALLLWMLAHLALKNESPGWRDWAALGGLLGLALLTKISLLIFIPLAGGVLVLRAWQTGKGSGWEEVTGRVLSWGGVTFGLTAVIAGWWYLRNWLVHGDPLAWSLVLAGVPLRETSLTSRDWQALLGGVFQSFWGRFGGAAHILLPTGLYLVCGGLTVLAGVGLGLGLARAWRSRRAPANWPALVVLAIAWVLVVGTWAQYSLVAAGTDQARLWYPALAAIVTFFVAGLAQWVRPAYRPALATALSAGTLVIGVWSLWFLHSLYTPRLLTPSDVPPIARWAAVDFGGEMALVGYAPPSAVVARDEPLQLAFYWQAQQPMRQDYRVSLRLLDQEGNLVWEWKRSPGAGRLPTDRWPPGAVIADLYAVPLDTSLSPGRYTLQVGVRHFLTDLWLPIGKSGQGENFFHLGEITYSPNEIPGLSTSNWQRWDEGLPSIAPVLTLAANPERPEVLYAGTYRLPGLWRSLDGGETWEQAGQAGEIGPYSHAVFVLLWDAGHQQWWAGTAGGLFFRPADSAAWQPVPELQGSVFHLALDESGRLYAVQADAGLFRQEKDGSWVCLRQEPRALTVGLSSTGQSLFLGTAGNGLWISHDGGQNWLPVPDWPKEYVSALLVDRKSSAWVYASISKGVYRSADFGRTWQAVQELDGRAYAFALTPDDTLYLGLKGHVACSPDGGQTWVGYADGLPSQAAIFDLLVVDQPEGGYVLYAASEDGVYRSSDRGKTWQRHREGLGSIEVTALAWDGEGRLLAALPLGLYRSSGEGKWQPVPHTLGYKPFYALASDATARTIYAGTQSGLARSTDGGQTWAEVISDLTPYGMPGVLVDSEDPNHVFIRLAYERVYESHDGGQTWEARWEGMETYHVVLSLARSRSGELWAGTQDGLFRWDRQGKQWRSEPLPLDNQSIFALEFAPDDATIYVGATEGLWHRPEGGQWRRCGTSEHTVTALAVLPGGHIYAGTKYYGLYRSCDRGATWHRVWGVPTDSTVKALLADAENGLIYVATDRGLFRGQDAACPRLTTSSWGQWAEWADVMTLKTLALSRRYAPPQPLPAVHTLRADDALLRQARDLGFGAVVQVFSWQEIEPNRGEWHWEYPDFLLRATEFYGLDLIVRLDQPPTWAWQTPTEAHGFSFATAAYLRFVEATAQRYRGRIQAYIIWNEPNLALEWGAPPDPVAYAQLLQQAYLTIKRVDPLARIISAGLAPTNEQSDQALDDRLFLEKMYQAGARPFFDALGAHPYGFAYPPDDPQGAHNGLNMNRLLALRATMEAHGDAAKPVWATEIGWTTRGLGEHAWFTVTPQEQADYLARAWQKAQVEFPWLQVFTVWNLSSGLPAGDEKAGYSILHEDGTPKPAYQALRQELTAGLGRRALALRQRLNALLPDPSPVPILAQDAEIHLGDSE